MDGPHKDSKTAVCVCVRLTMHQVQCQSGAQLPLTVGQFRQKSRWKEPGNIFLPKCGVLPVRHEGNTDLSNAVMTHHNSGHVQGWAM